MPCCTGHPAQESVQGHHNIVLSHECDSWLTLCYAHELFPRSVRAQVTVCATYTVENGQFRCSRHTFSLPAALFVYLVPPLKTNTARLTVALNHSPPAINDLFEDLAASSPAESSEVRMLMGPSSRRLLQRPIL